MWLWLRVVIGVCVGAGVVVGGGGRGGGGGGGGVLPVVVVVMVVVLVVIAVGGCLHVWMYVSKRQSKKRRTSVIE